MSLFENMMHNLTGSVGQNLDNNPLDILKVEKALMRTGDFNGEHSHGFITAELDKGIRKFQKDNNLKTDGVMYPNGETEQALLKQNTSAQSSNKPKPIRKPAISEISLYKAPIINIEADRIESKLHNTPAKFEIKDNESLKNPTLKEWATQKFVKSESIGNSYVDAHKNDIEELSKKHNVDSDLVKAVMWTENARGHYFGLNKVADDKGLSSSQLPMNINGRLWGELVNKKGERLDDVRENIEAGIILLKRISERIVSPTPAKIGTIYNSSGAEEINEIGAEVENAYRTKPWQNKDKYR